MVKKFDIKRLRLDRGLKQSDIASILHLPQSSISSMERGKSQVSQHYINTLVNELGVENVEEYYYDVEDMVYINNENNNGSNNGYQNSQNDSGINNSIILAKLAILERDLEEYNARTKRLEEKNERLDQENRILFRQLMAFQVLCAKNGIDFTEILTHS